MISFTVTQTKRKGKRKGERFNKELVTQGKSDRGAADMVDTDWRMNVIT